MLILSVAAATLAADPPDDVPDGMEWDAVEERLIGPEEIVERDAQRYADEFGWSVDYAKDRILTSIRIDRAMSELQRDPAFAGSYWGEGDGAGLTVMFTDAVPDDALDAVREQSLLPVEARVAMHSMKDLKRYQRRVRRIITEAGVENWGSGIGQVEPGTQASNVDPDALLIFVSVVVKDQQTQERIESRVAKELPRGVVDLDFRVVSTAAPRKRHDVCLRVKGGKPGTVKRIVKQLKAGTATVAGPGSDCHEWPWSSNPERGVCLRVIGSDWQTRSEIATDVRKGRAKVTGPGESCGPDPVPFIVSPMDGVTEVREREWQRIEVSGDGSTLRIYYRGRAFECHGLDRVEVSTSEAGVDVRLFTGYRPDTLGCPAIDNSYVTDVSLDEPVILGGAER